MLPDHSSGDDERSLPIDAFKEFEEMLHVKWKQPSVVTPPPPKQPSHQALKLRQNGKKI